MPGGSPDILLISTEADVTRTRRGIDGGLTRPAGRALNRREVGKVTYWILPDANSALAGHWIWKKLTLITVRAKNWRPDRAIAFLLFLGDISSALSRHRRGHANSAVQPKASKGALAQYLLTTTSNGPFGGCIPFQIVDQAPDTPPPQQENKPPPPKHVYVIDKPVTKCDYAPPPNINWGNSAYYKRDVNATGEFSGAELEKRWAESDEEKEDVPVLADDSDIEQALASIRKDEKSAKKTGKLPILCESLG
ncbi:uncharacterized protein DFL_009255 [Arthrobotrys flagrans]|uniref:Uncharacterized protein n=1 Tax=Arthrobotrys flagrans TaxID=97331 RepID=A0A436ZR50_ARTFL|nr:hypothetical protein DFL_009255 [Arthrobotrys flagrans]